MSDAERSCYLFNLEKHTEKVKAAFGSLVYDIQKHLEQKKVKDLVHYLNRTTTDKNLKEHLRDCSTTEELFDKLYVYSSFFDFEFLKRLTRKFGSRKIKHKLNRYIEMFRSYLKRRIVEMPNHTFDDVTESEKVYVVKTDKNFNDFTGEDLKKLQYQMNKILENKLLCLKHVEEGCVQLTFRGFEEDNFMITAEEKQDLRNVGVLSIAYGEHFMDFENEFIKKEVPFAG